MILRGHGPRIVHCRYTGSSRGILTGSRDHETPALMIAWAAAEPERVGEVALFEPDGGARILGRGEPAGGAGGARVVFHRQRPGVLERTAPLSSPGLSREQLRVRLEGSGLRIERVGKCAMELRSERVDRCVLEPGDALLLKGQLLLFCTRRPRGIEPLHSASLADCSRATCSSAPPRRAPRPRGDSSPRRAPARLGSRRASSSTSCGPATRPTCEIQAARQGSHRNAFAARRPLAHLLECEISGAV
jgi:hypothetical protein